MDTYEKKYKEAQKWIESIYPNLSHEQQMEAEAFFSELKESEDERIRKEIIYHIKNCDDTIDGETEKRMLAWLENIPYTIDHEKREGFHLGYKAGLEKQGEQEVNEPDWCHHKVDLSDCSEEYRKAYYDGWNNCNQQHSQCNAEQKPAWSEKDEKEYKYVLKFVDNILNNCGNKKDYEHCKRCYDWLKSLKQRIGG